MKKNEIVKLNKTFTMLKDLGCTKFKYFNIKNISILKVHIEPLETLEKENKELLSGFEKERNDLVIKLGEAKEDGRVHIDINDKEIVGKFNEELGSIAEKYKEDLEKYELAMNELGVVLDEEVDEEINFRTIKIEDCPEEGIKSEELELLMDNNLIT